MKSKPNPFTPSSSLWESKLNRRCFLKKVGLLTVSTTLIPVFSTCMEEEYEPKFYFAVLSDTHIFEDESKRTNTAMKSIIQILNSYEPKLDFVAITGDLCDYCYDDRPIEQTPLHYLKEYLGLFEIPVYPCMGNHDYYRGEWGSTNFWIRENKVREQLYIDHGILPAAYYKKVVNGIAFYFLNTHQKDDTIDWEPEVVGHFGKEQIAWLQSEMQDGLPSVFFFHVPLATPITAGCSILPFEVPRIEAGLQKYSSTVWNITDDIYPLILDQKASQIKAVFEGHTHRWISEEYNGIPLFMTDALKNEHDYDSLEDPMRFHIVECAYNSGNITIYNAEARVLHNQRTDISFETHPNITLK
jgi:hypothetical protein